MEILNRNLKDIKERKPYDNITFEPIGIIHSPLKSLKGIPIQFSMSQENGSVEIKKELTQGLKHLDGFSHIYCLYFFDLVHLPVDLMSKPFLHNEEKGVFATRTPFRPNPIGLSILEIDKIEDNIIYVNNLDILDQTPVLDIKPYVEGFDRIESSRSGWLHDKIVEKRS